MAAESANAGKLIPATTTDDDAVIVLDVSDISVGLERCSKSLIGRLLADRPFSNGTVESALSTIWRQPQEFKRWEEDKPIADADFAIVSVWIQFWSLPEHYKTIKLGQKLGSAFGPNQHTLEVSLKYEIIGSLCNYCGHIGHEIKNCNTHIDDSLKGEVQKEKWGDWLRSDQGGRRETMLKENLYPKIQQAEGGLLNKPNKPTPVNLIKSLASLPMQSQNGGQRREEIEVESNPNPLNSGIIEPATSILQLKDAGKQVGEDTCFTFGPSEPLSQNSSKHAFLKQQARKKFIKITGVKRVNQEGKGGECSQETLL
ncbi:hypothetical protein PIB30_049693 [Stylosanthes scabra]|uniref:CCHC-type domain-containing protein n=1 Tax=Stylosanthes scabra TaxID=79078 RepID=A0ABU6YG76_9FABA|nr:hypothetical protein [Stylosanthes scabra]